jgi:hypothetical protein
MFSDGAVAADPVLAPTTLQAAAIVANLAQARLDSGQGRLQAWWPTSRANWGAARAL